MPNPAEPQANGAADLDIPNFIRVYTIDAIGGEQVETYKNSSNQYFYNPLIIVDWDNYKSQLDKHEGENDTAQADLLLNIHHYETKVYDELKMLLERDQNIQNINLSNLPYTYFVLKARIGKEYIVINPTDLPTFSTVGTFQIKHMISKERNYEISGSLKNLRKFYNLRGSNDNLKGTLYMGGFEFSSDYVKGTADFANSTIIKKKLFGDETLIDNKVVKSKSGGGGLSLSLGPLKAGGSTVNSEVWTENEKKRIVNRNYTSDLILENQTEINILSMGDPDKVRDIRSQILNYLLDKVASQVSLEFQKVAENEYNLVKDSITYATLKDGEVDELLSAKPQSELTSSGEASVAVEGISGSKKDAVTSKGSDDITWTYKGNAWIPTKVDMYILSEYQLENSLSIDALSYNKEGKKTIEIPFIFPAAWLEDNPQSLNNQITDRDNPIGTILAFAGNTDKVPAGWKPCNGDILTVHDYTEIFNVIGYNWGQQPNNDFNLPDLRGAFLRGADDGRNIDPGRIVGTEQHFALQDHTHVSYKFNGAGGGRRPVGEDGGSAGAAEAEWSGQMVRGVSPGAQVANETRPYNYAVNYIIRCK